MHPPNQLLIGETNPLCLAWPWDHLQLPLLAPRAPRLANTINRQPIKIVRTMQGAVEVHQQEAAMLAGTPSHSLRPRRLRRLPRRRELQQAFNFLSRVHQARRRAPLNRLPLTKRWPPSCRHKALACKELATYEEPQAMAEVRVWQ